MHPRGRRAPPARTTPRRTRRCTLETVKRGALPGQVRSLTFAVAAVEVLERLHATFRKGKPFAAYLYLPRPRGTQVARTLDEGFARPRRFSQDRRLAAFPTTRETRSICRASPWISVSLGSVKSTCSLRGD